MTVLRDVLSYQGPTPDNEVYSEGRRTSSDNKITEVMWVGYPESHKHTPGDPTVSERSGTNIKPLDFLLDKTRIRRIPLFNFYLGKPYISYWSETNIFLLM